MRLLFVNRFFHPDHSATSQILSDLAFYLAEAGFGVEVLTSRQMSDAPSQILPRDEILRGVRVHRVWTTRFGRGRLLPRVVDYLTFYLGATAKLLALTDQGTVVIAETDPPLMSIPAALVGRLRRAKLVNWTQDLFPEIAEVLSVPGISILAALLRWARKPSLTEASANVVLGDSMAAYLRSQGVSNDRIVIIPNWSLSESESVTEPGEDHPLRKEWDLEAKFVVGYSGNFGRAHDFGAILDAASLLRERTDVRFILIGDGAQRAWLEDRITTMALTNVVMKPYQPLERLHLSLSLPDVHLVSLKAELEGLLVPSKLYAVLAAGRGVLFIGKVDGEISDLLRESGCGQAFANSAGGDLAAGIRELADNRMRVALMGKRARHLWDTRFRRSQALARWQELLTDVSGKQAT